MMLWKYITKVCKCRELFDTKQTKSNTWGKTLYKEEKINELEKAKKWNGKHE